VGRKAPGKIFGRHDPCKSQGDGRITSIHTTNVLKQKGAIGFDWVTVEQGGVPRLISWPRKKLIKQ